MSHTNSTTNYSLPQFIATDQPGWMSDVNSAMQTIDTAVKAVSDAGVTNAGDIATINTTLSANLPTTGSVGQVLTKTATGATYQNIPVDLAFDVNSNDAIANSTVTTKVNTIDSEIVGVQTDLAGLGSARAATVTGSGITGSCTYAQVGKLVVGSFTINSTGNIAANTVVITGLPHSTVNNELVEANNNNNATTVRMYLDTNGRITVPAAISGAASLRGGFAFIAS